MQARHPDATAAEPPAFTVVTADGVSLLEPLQEHIAACASPVRAALGQDARCYVHVNRHPVGTRPGATTGVRVSVLADHDRLSVYHEDPSVFSAVRDAFRQVLELISLNDPDELSGVRPLPEA